LSTRSLLRSGSPLLRSRWLPRSLGWILVAGGVGYLLSAFVTYLLPNADSLAQLLTVPSVVGEVWMMGYLLLVGVREHPSTGVAAVPAPR